MPNQTDRRFLALLASRGFFPDPPVRPGARDNPINQFVGRINDPHGNAHKVYIWCDYGWRREDDRLPKRIRISVAAAPSKAYVKLVGQHKLIVRLDEAVQTAIILANLYNRITDAKDLKRVANQMLEGDHFANANYINHPGRPPAPLAGTENRGP